MPRGSDVYKNPWLKAEDLEDDEETFTIIGSDIHEFTEQDGKRKSQIVLMFRETEKKFGLNVTNYSVLKELFRSDDSDDWHGKQVVLFVTQTTMTDGRQVDCLRIKKKATEKLRDAQASQKASRKRYGDAEPARATQPQPQPMTQAEVDGDEDIELPF